MNTIQKIVGNKKALVLGLGKSGVSTLDFFERHKVAYDAYDDNIDKINFKKTYSLLKKEPNDLSSYSVLVPAPGIPHTHTLIQNAKKAGLKIIGDIELFYLSEPQGQTIAITGTNGKSTTTALIYHILTENNIRANIGGNFGNPVLDFDLNADVHVIETSSYQLDLLDKTEFDIAVHLNLTPDHLERHGSMEGYRLAKERIFKNAGKAVVGIDDEYSQQIAQDLTQSKNNILTVSVQNEDGDIVVYDHVLYCNGQDIFDLSKLEMLKGVHNEQNIACAFTTCLFYGLEKNKILESIKTFQGLEHRQEFVAKYKNISFINDSKATNADATAKALASYSNIYWIVGGRPKQGGLDGLEPYLDDIKHSFLVGEASLDFAKWHETKHAPFTPCETITNATKAATQKALEDGLKNAVVLLSPACASWDQYPNFEARGQDFIDVTQQTIHSYKNKDKK